jgi:hypothetical protein
MEIGEFKSRISARSAWKAMQWTRFRVPGADVRALPSLFSEIAVVRPAIPPIRAAGELSVPADVPEFVSQMIKEARSPESQCCRSFVDIVERPKQNPFEIVVGVDSDEISAFVAQVQSAEQSDHWE